ncbi:hypothetical protein Tco_0776315 [Tanacetum coccineum]
MPPKRTSTSETPTMTQDAIRQLIADRIATVMEAQAATMANTNRNCAEEDRVTFATGTLTDDALSWWNAYAQPIGIEQANRITWNELKRLLTNKRFQELAVLCPNMVLNTEKLMEAFIGGLPQSIEGNVTASKPQTLEEATNIAHRLMDQILKRDSVQETTDHKMKCLMIEGTPLTTTTIPIIVISTIIIISTTTPIIATTITTSTIATTITTKITITTTNSRIEDKKLLGLIMPKDTMETFLCVQDAPCITHEFALLNVRLVTK